MNQTLSDLNGTLSNVITEKRLIQSILKRLDVLEARPDATREMLAEYVRNFDTLDNAVRSITTTIRENDKNQTQKLARIKGVVDSYHWIIDKETIQGIENLVTKETGFSLQKYVSKVQKDIIDAQFNKLIISLNTKIKPIIEEQQKQEEKINELYDANEILLDKIITLTDNVKYLAIIVSCVLVGAIIAGFGLLITAFSQHPILATIGSIFTLSLLFLLSVIIYKDYQVDKAEAEKERKNEEYDD